MGKIAAAEAAKGRSLAMRKDRTISETSTKEEASTPNEDREENQTGALLLDTPLQDTKIILEDDIDNTEEDGEKEPAKKELERVAEETKTREMELSVEDTKKKQIEMEV